MNTIEAITLAMSAAAAAQFRPNSFFQKRPDVQAYLALKQLLAAKYPAVESDIFDISPASEERRNIFKTQLQQAGAAKDAAVLRQAAQLLHYLLRHDPNSATAVFAAPHELQNAAATLTRALEAAGEAPRNRSRYPHHPTPAATPA